MTAGTPPGITIWFTGLSGTGKTTISRLLAERLAALDRRVERLDGDELRATLSSDLGFSRADRDANIARIGWVCQMLNRHGVDAVVAAISPYREARDAVRASVPAFVEVHLDASLDTLRARDPKGLYERSAAGDLAGFTGVDDPYEPPLRAEVVARTDDGRTPDSVVEDIVRRLGELGLLADTRDEAAPVAGGENAAGGDQPAAATAYTEDEESEVTDRLRDLGYL